MRDRKLQSVFARLRGHDEYVTSKQVRSTKFDFAVGQMGAATVVSICLLLVIGNSKGSICNYVYEVDTTHAYPTDVCMQLGANQYIKYQCAPSSQYPSDYTILMQSFLSNECDTNDIVQEFDLNEWVKSNNQEYNTSMQITYNCGGIDRCFVEYEDECNNNANRYYPLDQCLNDYNKFISFKYACDASSNTFSYHEYDGIDCKDNAYISEKSLVKVTGTECMNYVQCQSTPYPTISPTTTSMPTQMPSFFIPFKNKSLEAVVDILSNGTYESSATEHKLSVLAIIVAAINIFM